MAAKKGAVLLFVLLTLLVSSAAVASIRRTSVLDHPSIDRYATNQVDDAMSIDNARLLHRALARALPPPAPIASVSKSRVWIFSANVELVRRVERPLSRSLRRGWARAWPGVAENRTVLTPDPLGYKDSSNLYAYCAGNPIGCSDPTGLAASVSQSGVIIGARPDGTRYRIEPGTDPVEALRTLESDADIRTGAEQEDILRRAGMATPYSSAPRPGEYLIGSGQPNYRAYTHLPSNGRWVEAAFVGTTGLPPQTREQQIMSGVIQTGSTLVTAFVAPRAYAGTVSAEPVVRLSAGNVTAPIPITIADQWRLPNGNRLDASGPHDVYAVVDRETRQVYHFGETGRGWETRGREWQRNLQKAYGLDTDVVALRTGLSGKAAAKQLETRYITTYEKAFGRRPFYINEQGEVITIQKTRH